MILQVDSCKMKSEIQLFIRVPHTGYSVSLRFNVHDTEMKELVDAQFECTVKRPWHPTTSESLDFGAGPALKTGDDSSTSSIIKTLNCCEKQIFIFQHIFMVLSNDYFM